MYMSEVFTNIIISQSSLLKLLTRKQRLKSLIPFPRQHIIIHLVYPPSLLRQISAKVIKLLIIQVTQLGNVLYVSACHL